MGYYDLNNRMNPRSVQGRYSLIYDIDSYLRSHSDYYEGVDKSFSGWDRFSYGEFRYEYWLQRANGNQLEAHYLHSYYNYHIVPQMANRGSKDWKIVGLDIVGLASSVIGLNPIANAFKLSKSSQEAVNAVNMVTGGISTMQSVNCGDGLGTMFNILGFVPGTVGAVGSAGSIVLDLIPDVTFSPYIPSIPR